jgi:methylmalonyl-CoA mutase N-terminal domain/subunit
MQLRFHTQTAGVSLTAQQAELNIARVAMQALSGVLGGTQSLHTDSFDEALALPTEKAARIALRTQHVIAHETGAALVADPLGGSHYVEWMTDEMERQAEEVFAHLDDIGGGSILEGVYAGIEDNWFQGEIADAAYAFEKTVVAGRGIVVGVNSYTAGDEDRPPILSVGAEAEQRQLERLAKVKASRDDALVAAALARVAADAAQPDTNVMPGLVDAVRSYATVGELIDALAGVFGRWTENPVI